MFASTLPWFGVEIMISAATSRPYAIAAPLRSTADALDVGARREPAKAVRDHDHAPARR